ncbi:hypothetical protein SDC9_165813 [bioreactor metagenome]|uniref:Uncharacterized protein n=1 Tax=bioreactor metagenome TaxID=1076179 RepID=A0A645G2W3_9ZZZZ
MLLDEAVKLLDDDGFINALCKIADKLYRQGIDHAELQNRVPVAADFLDVLVARPGGDYANAFVASGFDPVTGRAFGVLDKSRRARLDDRVALYRVAGDHYVFCAVFGVGFRFGRPALAEFDHALSVGYARAHLEDYGGVERFGESVGENRKILGFLRVGGLKHRQLRRLGVMAGILLVLRAMHSRVVGYAYDHTAVYAGVGECEQRVGRDVEPDVLHAAEAALSGKRRAAGGFHGNLFVRSPLGIYLIIFCVEFGYFGAWGAGIA